MRIVIIGGSAHSTPGLFDIDPPFRADRFCFDLVGRDRRRLEAVRRATQLVGDTHGAPPRCRVSHIDDLDTTLRGADVVLIQIRADGYTARAWDERFPHRHALCGDEGLGAGGLAAAWRTWPHVVPLLSAVERACPAALVLLLTSPVGILTRCALDAFARLRIAGICELPWTTLRDVCVAAGIDAGTASFTYAGVNHLGWLADIRSRDGRVAHKGPVALKYVRLHDEPESVLAEQRAAQSRALELEALAERAFDVYERGDANAILTTLRRRSTPWYREAVAPLLGAFAGATAPMPFFLTVRNEGYLLEISDEDVVEIPFRASSGELQRHAPVTTIPPGIATGLARLVGYERRAAAAVRSREVTGLAAALRLHPWLDDKPVSSELIADITAPVEAALATIRP